MGQGMARGGRSKRMSGETVWQVGEGGFTLIELMVCVVIVAVLATLAYPRYTQHLDGARLVEARSSLTAMAAGLERCYSRYLRYDASPCQLPAEHDELEGYRLVQEVAESRYLLTAEALDRGMVPSGCETLRLDQTGKRAPDECW
ncbi:prepilin-type N-terminal cleavage/methylation domain-containing protein [Halomonas cupida]|uniref:type IV pilin protein n=1 Tax=Halomonas cupida TaxID=44933 RepID=UPI0039B4354B